MPGLLKSNLFKRVLHLVCSYDLCAVSPVKEISSSFNDETLHRRYCLERVIIEWRREVSNSHTIFFSLPTLSNEVQTGLKANSIFCAC